MPRSIHRGPVRLQVETSGEKGLGVYAREPFETGEVLLRFGGPRLAAREVSDFMRVLCIGPDLYLGSSGGPDDMVNHSCDPNARVLVSGRRVMLLARRPIAAGDELTMDYSASMVGEPPLEGCRCGAARCRGTIRSFNELLLSVQRRLIADGLVSPPILAAAAAQGLARARTG